MTFAWPYTLSSLQVRTCRNTNKHKNTQAQCLSHLRNAKYLPLLPAWMTPPIRTTLFDCPLTYHLKIPHCLDVTAALKLIKAISALIVLLLHFCAFPSSIRSHTACSFRHLGGKQTLEHIMESLPVDVNNKLINAQRPSSIHLYQKIAAQH